jgi:uncharacterized protein YdaU (DUF1376 family)
VKAPWFKLWAEEMLREMRWLTSEQRGYLFSLMCEAWVSEPRGSMPINRDMIWRLAGADSKEKFEASSGAVLEMFEQSGERYWYRKLVNQDREIRQVSQSRSDAGKNGAKSRWQGDGKQMANVISGNGKKMTSVISSNGKANSKGMTDLDSDSDLDQEKMRDGDGRLREEDLAPVGSSATGVASPLTYEYEEGDEDIPF